MPPNLDVYVLSKRRDQETIHRFIETWADREASEERGDEELMMLPLGVTDCPQETEGWDWEPAGTLTHIIQRGLTHPSRAFAIYLKPRDTSLVDGVCLAFTADGQVVFGVSIDDSDEAKEGLVLAKRTLVMLANKFDADLGCVGCEEPPALVAAYFPRSLTERVLLTWSREAT